jgi:hypothetical protein
MSYWDYDEPMWEPSEADELFDEIKSKLINSAKDSLKHDMESLRERNERLSKRVAELEKKEREVAQRERDVKYKEENLRREVEKEFYKTAIEDIFKDALEKSQLWFADDKPHTRPKCNKCDADRKWVLTWPDGDTVTKACDCARPDYWYEPQETWIDVLKYKVKDSNYQSERYYRLEKHHQYTGASRYYDDYSYSEFGIQFVYDEFCDDVIEKHEQLRRHKRIGFKSKEECQKYCDYLNNLRGENE